MHSIVYSLMDIMFLFNVTLIQYINIKSVQISYNIEIIVALFPLRFFKFEFSL